MTDAQWAWWHPQWADRFGYRYERRRVWVPTWCDGCGWLLVWPQRHFYRLMLHRHAYYTLGTLCVRCRSRHLLPVAEWLLCLTSEVLDD